MGNFVIIPNGTGGHVEFSNIAKIEDVTTIGANHLVVATNNSTQNSNTLSLSSLAISQAKVYEALITQSGTAAPSVTAFNNSNPIGTIVWTRSTTGIYAGTLNGAFTMGKTVCFAQSVSAGSTVNVPGNIGFGIATADAVTLMTSVSSGALSDGLLNASIIIKVFP